MGSSQRSMTERAAGSSALNLADPLSTADKVVDHINQGILNGRLVPGQRLTESDLTEILGVSRGPVREALRRLEAQGVVGQTPHRGACIRALSRQEASDLLMAVEPLAGLMANLAAGQMLNGENSPERRRGFERELHPYQDREEDVADLLSQRRHFYEVLMEIGANSQLPSLLPALRIHVLRLQIHSFLGLDDRRRHLQEYADIAGAVLSGEAKRAEKLMRSHMQRMRTAVETLPDEAFPRTARLGS
jgi:DNA-binding GntR family transcriptional regulator